MAAASSNTVQCGFGADPINYCCTKLSSLSIDSHLKIEEDWKCARILMVRACKAAYKASCIPDSSNNRIKSAIDCAIVALDFLRTKCLNSINYSPLYAVEMIETVSKWFHRSRSETFMQVKNAYLTSSIDPLKSAERLLCEEIFKLIPRKDSLEELSELWWICAQMCTP